MTTISPLLFADRMKNIPESFIREILKVSSRPEMISFAGGLPNPDFFPVEKIAAAAEKVLSRDGTLALQYWITEGYLPLRDYIAQWQSRKAGRQISPEDILILNGSQQGIDLSAKLFLNLSSHVLLEGPSYLGAIQSMSAYQPIFHHIPVDEGGPDPDLFLSELKRVHPALFYCIPNFQNPTGNTYDLAHRNALAAIGNNHEMTWIEDNPYGEIFFEQQDLPDFFGMMPDKTISLGSFSKIISPGMRMGWAMGPNEMIKKMAIVKQACDLHSNHLMQRIVYQFLVDNPLENHLNSIRLFYKEQAETMQTCMRQFFPSSVRWIKPRGGMFIWVTLPDGLDANVLLQKAVEQCVLFVPGNNFYVGGSQGNNTLRMNFSNPSKDDIHKGIQILGSLINTMVG